MSERLIIRLASKASQKQHWLIWSEDEKEIIASGEVDNAEQLNSLAEKAVTRQVICLLPGIDVTIREVVINGTFNRQMQQALPYLIEEDLAGDVDKLHFSVIAKRKDLVHVAICEKQHMHNWLAWLSEANINCKQFIPEGLALPIPTEESWQAVQLDNDWIVRESSHLAWSCEGSMLALLLASKADENKQQIIESASPVPEQQYCHWVSKPGTLPMQLLTIGTIGNKINLLTGEFQASKEVNETLRKWRLPIIFIALLFIASCLNLYIESQKIKAQTEFVKEQVEGVYSLAFPNHSKLRYIRIKRQITAMLNDGGDKNASAEFLLMLKDVAPSFQQNKQLAITTFKYDIRRQEMRIVALGDNFQAFEKLATELPEYYTLQQGALNSSNDKVTGLLTIRKKQ